MTNPVTGSKPPSPGMTVHGNEYHEPDFEEEGVAASLVGDHEAAADPHTGYIKHSLATAISDFLVASGAGAFVKKTLAQVKVILGLGTATTDIYSNSDYGLKWTDLGAIATHIVRSIVYLGNGVVILGSFDKHVYRSIDFGANWSDLGVITSGIIRAMAQLGNGVAILGDSDGHVHRSTDYGKTWTDLGVISSDQVYSMTYLGNGIAILGDRVFHVWRSTDWGATWADLGVIASNIIKAISYLSNGIAVLGDWNTRIYRSVDYGATWVNTGETLHADVQIIVYLGNGIAVAGDGGNHIHRSTDYGLTWTDLGAIASDEIRDIAHLGNGIVILGDAAGHVYRSVDCGANWTDLGAITPNPIYSIAYLDNGIALLGDDDGHVYRSTSAFHVWNDGLTPHASEHENGGADEIGLAGLDGEPSTLAAHKVLTTGVHGVGAGTIAEVADIAVDANLSVAGQDAISKKHTQDTDTALGALGTKATPVNADKVIQRNSAAADALVTSTWTQIKAFLKTHFDTLYEAIGAVASHSALATGIHGVGASTVDSVAARIAAIIAAIAAHAGLTTATHGVAGAIVGTSDTQVFINKTLIATSNVVEEYYTFTSTTTPIPSGGSLRNFFTLTALAANATFVTPSGTPANGNKLIIRIKDNGTTRTLGWDAIYRAMEFALPTDTIAGKTVYLGFIYNSADTKWDMVAINEEA